MFRPFLGSYEVDWNFLSLKTRKKKHQGQVKEIVPISHLKIEPIGTYMNKWCKIKQFLNLSEVRYVFIMGLQSSMSVLDGSSTRHVDLQSNILDSDQACWSPLRYVSLRWDMSVSDGSSIRPVSLRRVFDQKSCSPMGHWLVSTRSPIIIIFL